MTTHINPPPSDLAAARALIAAAEAKSGVANAEELKAATLAELRDQLARLEGKAERDARQATDTALAVEAKAAELAAAEVADYEFVQPQEHVTVRPSSGTGS